MTLHTKRQKSHTHIEAPVGENKRSETPICETRGSEYPSISHSVTGPDTEQSMGEPDNNNDQLHSNTPWEAQVGWIYAGHGEWIPIEGGQDTSGYGNALKQEPKWVQHWLNKHDADVQLLTTYQESGLASHY